MFNTLLIILTYPVIVDFSLGDKTLILNTHSLHTTDYTYWSSAYLTNYKVVLSQSK